MRDLVLGYRQDELKGVVFEVRDDVVKLMVNTEVEREFLANSTRFLKYFEGSAIAPELLEVHKDYIIMERIPEEPITDEVAWRRNCAQVYRELKDNGIKHGDLTKSNIRSKSNAPVILDWHQASFNDDEWPFEKRTEGDGHWFWKTVAEMSPDTSRHLRRWNAIREDLQDELVYDFGCDEADFGRLCSAERIDYHGFDINEAAVEKSGNMATVADITKMSAPKEHSLILLMSVWAHLGFEEGDALLKRLIQNGNSIIFETQLKGDGPGIHNNDREVYDYLQTHTKYVDWMAQIPVYGRNTARSVWYLS